jgi:hypothetical protein
VTGGADRAMDRPSQQQRIECGGGRAARRGGRVMDRPSR